MVQLDTSALGRVVNDETVSQSAIGHKKLHADNRAFSRSELSESITLVNLEMGEYRSHKSGSPMMGCSCMERDLMTIIGNWTE